MIDFHTHFFSRPFFVALAEQSPQDGTVDERLARVVDRTGLELPAADVSDHWARWKGMLDEHRVDHLVSFASLPDEVPALVEAMALADGRMSSFALVNPRVEGAADKVRTLLGDKGFSGVLLFPAMHGYDLAGDEAGLVFEAVEERSAIAVVHCGLLSVKLRDLLGLPRTYDFTLADPLRLVPAANRHRGVRFVIPHFGAGMFRETLMVGSACENVCVDTSSSNGWMATQPTPIDLETVFRRTRSVFGADRIVFGTDSSTLPRGWRSDLHAAQLVAMEKAGFSEDDRSAVLDGNARRLLGKST